MNDLTEAPMPYRVETEVFAAARASFAAAGRTDAFHRQLARALMSPDGFVRRGHDLFFFGWWVDAVTVYVARLEGPGAAGWVAVLEAVADEAARRGVARDALWVQWLRERNGRMVPHRRQWERCWKHGYTMNLEEALS